MAASRKRTPRPKRSASVVVDAATLRRLADLLELAARTLREVTDPRVPPERLP